MAEQEALQEVESSSRRAPLSDVDVLKEYAAQFDRSALQDLLRNCGSYNPLSAHLGFIFCELFGVGKSSAIVICGKPEEFEEAALQARRFCHHDLRRLSAMLQGVPLHRLEPVDHPAGRWPAARTPFGIDRQGLDLLALHCLAELPFHQGLRQQGEEVHAQKRLDSIWTDFR